MFDFNIFRSLFFKAREFWAKLSRKKKPIGFTGSPEPLRLGSTMPRNLALGMPEIPVRPILGDRTIPSQLIEMGTWSLEVRHTARILSTDMFQQEDGRIGSWKIKPTIGDEDDGTQTKIDANLLAVGREMGVRQFGKDLILGGTALQTAVARMVKYGDAFVELGLNVESKKKNDYFIEKIQYLPTFSMFVDVDDQGVLKGTYSQRKQIDPRPDDRLFPDWKILHFKLEELGASGRYGQSLYMQALEVYEYLREHVPDVADSVRSAAVAPWLHIMPEMADENYKNDYMSHHKALLAQGVVSNLYLLQGTEVKKAMSNGNDSIKSVLDYWTQLRYQMIPPGLPLWFFPGLGLESNSGTDIANQPALMYARTISALRGLVGEQIKWAITLEYVMKFGYDAYQTNVVKKGGFELDWGTWAVNGQEFLMKSQAKTENQSTQNSQLQSGASASSNGNGNGKKAILLN
ncbi:MAG: hypothetical protein V7L23_15190 [Nostoc sp.]|uniref:hypothetical protein n=1 Tax=Nostoc sp. TaxID=1180 RepID=UPI002FF33C07